MTETNQIVEKIARACDDKRAENIVVLDMDSISLVADYFLICHATNERQVQAIARAVREVVEENSGTVQVMEGYEQARWIVLDAEDVICHIFHKDERSYYNLERLWGDAPHVDVNLGESKK